VAGAVVANDATGNASNDFLVVSSAEDTVGQRSIRRARKIDEKARDHLTEGEAV
jgi:hypothetical protein